MSDADAAKSAKSQKGSGDLETDIRERIIARDQRYQLPAYLFIYEALAFTQHLLGRDAPNLEPAERHVSGQELLDGIRRYAGKMFGPLAPTVFRNWGVQSTKDFGEIVFNLVENNLLGKTEGDRREDFANGFDMDTVFEEPLKAKPE